MKALATAVALVILSCPLPAGAEVVEHGGRYLPGAVTAIWCSSDNHNLAPIGNREDYSNPLRWLFSGGPQCAGADAWNAARELQGEEREEIGVGGFAWLVAETHFDTVATVWADDEWSGENIYLQLHWEGYATPDQTAEGCGPQSVILTKVEYNWQPTTPQPPTLLWAIVHPVGMEADLTVCFSSTGRITGQYGA